MKWVKTKVLGAKHPIFDNLIHINNSYAPDIYPGLHLFNPNFQSSQSTPRGGAEKYKLFMVKNPQV